MKSFSRLVPRLLLCFSIAALAIEAGCSRDDGIRQYAVENIPSQAPPLTSRAPQSSPAWFFKMTGPSDQVLGQIVPFTSFVKTLRFDVKRFPLYDLPAGWTATDGPQPRYQTLKIPNTDPPLELSVSSLPGPEGALDKYLLSNIDRWRGQIGLKPYDPQNWLTEARSSGELMIAPVDSWILAIVNLVGETKEQGPTRVLGAIILFPPGEAEQPASQTSSVPAPSRPPFQFKTPEGWKVSAGNAMRLASFEAKHDAGIADVSVTRIPGGGDALSNVNRWRGQVKLDPLTEEELKSTAKEIPVDGQIATYIEAVGPEQTILAAMIPDGDAKWFFKMQGPKDAVAAETAHFEEFIKSVKFQSPADDEPAAQKTEKMEQAPAAVPAKSAAPFDFQMPEGWKNSAGNAMRLASFEAKKESGVADISVTKIPGGGDSLSNVNRWRGQVKLDPLTEEELTRTSKELEVGGLKSIYVEAVGPEETILAAIVPDGDSKWFFKMQGPKAAVAEEAAHFEALLKSVKFHK